VKDNLSSEKAVSGGNARAGDHRGMRFANARR
jgi:hypothetical protein